MRSAPWRSDPEEGLIAESAGFCDIQDFDGDTVGFDWQADDEQEAGQAAGDWTWTDGTGKFEGIKDLPNVKSFFLSSRLPRAGDVEAWLGDP